ncbi:MAG: matrixin family metalloprotease [Acidobacteria bacterium]|nr:matrixin family metalloprotease [Acidobacteriota bacterium]
MKSSVVLLLVALVGLGHPAPAFAYLKFGFRLADRTIDVRWPAGPIRYFVNDRDIPGVSAGDFRSAITRAAATWQAVPGTSLAFEDQGMTAAPPGGLDGRNTLGFLDRPDLDRVLGATSLLLDSATGALVEADVFLNTRFQWSVSPQGAAGFVDVESIVLHELGHLIGLGHSAIGETERTASGGRRVLGSGAVMFPIALTPGATSDRVLQADDIAAVTDLYGVDPARASTGSIRGRVVKNGRGVFGAHVVAFNPVTGTLIGGFTLSADGEFVLAGLQAGPHVVRVEPLDDADVESFLSGEVDVDFGVAYAPRLVVAPRGGSSAAIEIPVDPK